MSPLSPPILVKLVGVNCRRIELTDKMNISNISTQE